MRTYGEDYTHAYGCVIKHTLWHGCRSMGEALKEMAKYRRTTVSLNIGEVSGISCELRDMKLTCFITVSEDSSSENYCLRSEKSEWKILSNVNSPRLLSNQYGFLVQIFFRSIHRSIQKLRRRIRDIRAYKNFNQTETYFFFSLKK